jgi:malate permease and related proteins
MENVILIFVCLGIGLLLQRSKDFPVNSFKVLNQFVIYVSLPSLALYYIPKIKLSEALWYPIGIAWGGFVLSYLFFSILGKRFGWSKKLIGCLIICAGLSNTSFVGFPVVEALYGKEGLQTAIIVDQPGSFVVLATLAVIIATIYAKGKTNVSLIVKKIFFFPPFIAFTVACLMNLFKTDFSDVFQLVFQKIGNTVTPVALISVGLQLKIERSSKHWQFLGLGLFFKLLVFPAFFYLFYVLILKQKGIMIQVSIIEAAMAPMITGAVLASNYGLKPKLCSMMIGLGIPLSFITLAFWYWVLTML